VVVNGAYVDPAFLFIQNDSYNSILKFGTHYAEHSILL